MKPRAFTLIELLVVIAIIGILSAIVIASLSTARQRASIGAGEEFDSSTYDAVGINSVGTWNFDGSTNDSSGFGNNGTIIGAASYSPGIYGQSICLNAGTVNFGTSSSFDTNNFTISFWIKPVSINSGTGDQNIIFGRETYITSGFRMGISSNQNVSFWTFESGGTINLVSNTTLALGQFYNVAVSYNGTTATMYINGASVASQTGTFNIPVGDNLVLNGGSGGTLSSNSCFDNVRFYTQSLSAMEIKNNYLAEAPEYALASSFK